MFKFLFGIVVGVYLVVLHAIIGMFVLLHAVENPEKYPAINDALFGKKENR